MSGTNLVLAGGQSYIPAFETLIGPGMLRVQRWGQQFNVAQTPGQWCLMPVTIRVDNNGKRREYMDSQNVIYVNKERTTT